MGRRTLVVAAIAVIATTVGASSADATTPLTKAQYIAMLKRASARVGKVETAVGKGSQFEHNPRPAEDADPGVGEHGDSTRAIVSLDPASGDRG